jgi:ADP-L-glycero-D-manno-heptose 6-epimerase
MMVVTGAAGFVGSCLIQRLNELNFNYIVAVDHFDNTEKKNNLVHKKIQEYVDRDQFFEWLEKNNKHIDFIFHIGARTDTTEFDKAIFDKLNVE